MGMVLRKRKAPEPAMPLPLAKKPAVKKEKKEKKAVPEIPKAKAFIAPKKASSPPKETKEATQSTKPVQGDRINLDGFGGEVTTTAGCKVTLKDLLNDSEAGVVLFTYPKAKTGGCTNQVKLFRDAHSELVSTGLSIFGLSNDSPKANGSFKQQQGLMYELLCDPDRTLISAIGLRTSVGKTQRGIFVINKQGKILAAEPGGPAATVEVAKQVVSQMKDNPDETLVDEAGEAETKKASA
ncbi:hypothetical protein ACRALDRAFT_1074779 [Sodiomyces alcalophilus JCM 7366]|uniref:uncharacterized protein n=1 Tax=Sodiomyces alcalophilus JCM 7366 TaxID=591952 RepID=UPI0039B4643D